MEPASGPAAPHAKPGWELRWGRDARIVSDIGAMAPCDVYQANFRIVPVTEAAYAKRLAQIRSVISNAFDVDVLVFQEVNNEHCLILQKRIGPLEAWIPHSGREPQCAGDLLDVRPLRRRSATTKIVVERRSAQQRPAMGSSCKRAGRLMAECWFMLRSRRADCQR